MSSLLGRCSCSLSLLRPVWTTTTRVVTTAFSSTPEPASKGEERKSGSLRITDACVSRLQQILEKDDSFLRVSVEGGGCSGFQYKFEIDHQLDSQDIVVRKGGGGADDKPLVVVDPVSLDLVRGSTLDYETELIRSSFRIVSNPRAEQGCSCGASFNMKID